MRYPSAEELRAAPRLQELARLEDRVIGQLLAAKASDRGADSAEAIAAVVALLLSIAAREGVAAAAAAGERFDEEAFAEAARASARWAARRMPALTDAPESLPASCETH